ncbi:MAG: hypothetical protein IOD12_02855 [Silvanigrellales bacterium]|nr:hypothetical protein [Silvanigrellales bacterium]
MTLGHMMSRTNVEPLPFASSMKVSVSAVALCFDGQQLCVLLRESEGGHPPSLPIRPYLAHRSIHDVAAESLADMGVQGFRGLKHVDAFEPAKTSDASLELVTLSVCKPLASIARGDKPAESPGLKLSSGATWIPLSRLESMTSVVRPRVDGALSSLRQKARFESVAFDFLDQEFSLSELQRVFEAILGKTIDVRNFRKKIESLDILVESSTKPRGMAYRPPRLFRFDLEKFHRRVAMDGEIRFF